MIVQRGSLIVVICLVATACGGTGSGPLLHVTNVTGAPQSAEIDVEYVGGECSTFAEVDAVETGTSIILNVRAHRSDGDCSDVGVIAHTTLTLTEPVGTRVFTDGASGTQVNLS